MKTIFYLITSILFYFLVLGSNTISAQVVWHYSSTQSSGGSTSNTQTFNKPSGTVSTDLIIVHLYFKDRPISITAPSGFILIQLASSGANPGDDAAVYAYYKLAGSSEPTSYSFSRSGVASTWNIMAVRVTGHDISSPISNSSAVASTSATSLTMASLNAAYSSSLSGVLVSALTTFDSYGTPFTHPTGMSPAYNISSSPSYVTSLQDISVNGSTGSRTYTWTTARAAAAIMYFIKPFAIGPDLDSDGITDMTDLDDDNDGILDVAEGKPNNGSAYFDRSGGAASSTLSLPPSRSSIVLDIYRLDNSFNFRINGQHVFVSSNLVFVGNPYPNEVNFQYHASFTRQAQFQDGTYYGDGTIPQIYDLGLSNPATPKLRIIIKYDGTVKIFGSKTNNGPLVPMEFVNVSIGSYSYYTSGNTNNVFQFGQATMGGTNATGFIYYQDFDIDFDKDGIADMFDNDSDNDGIPDALEASHSLTAAQIDDNGRLIYASLVNGVPNIANSGNGFTPTNSDSDALADYIDIDSDNDGIVDVIESQPTTGYKAPTGFDTDGDGIDNAYDVNTNAANTLTKTLTNTDGIDTPDVYDTDTDNDGLSDYLEAYDTNVNGIIDGAEKVPAATDTDGDGLLDTLDLNVLSTNPATNATNGGQTAINPFPYRLENSEGLWRDAVCQIVGSTTGVATPSITAISLMTTHATGWPGAINNGYLVLESKTKGMVITRMPTASLPTGANAIQGMLVYDTTANCLKMYNGSVWGCITAACPE